MAENQTSARRAKARRLHPRHSRGRRLRRKLYRAIAAGLVFFFTFATTGLALGYLRLQGNIDQHDIDKYLGSDRPTTHEPKSPQDKKAGQPLNILVLGSDSRGGANSGVDGSGTSEGMRADTTMLVHVSADRKSIGVISIPRDTLVSIPECLLPNGKKVPARRNAMFNSAFAFGGQTGNVGAAAACSMRTVERMTGVRIDGFVVVDFVGFMRVVDALGGIAMNIPTTINDRAADLNLQAGCRLLNGKAALGYARVRKTLTGGSDIGRIGRQQDIVMEIINEALRSKLLSDPVRLYRVLDSATQTLETSKGLGDLTTLAGLASSLAGIDRSKVTLVTMPFKSAPDGNRVLEAKEYSERLWQNLRADKPLDPTVTGANWELAAAGVLTYDEVQAGNTPKPPPPSAPEVETPTLPVPSPSSQAPKGNVEKQAPTCSKENAS